MSLFNINPKSKTIKIFVKLNEPYSTCDTRPYLDKNHRIINNRINCEFECKARYLNDICNCLPPDAEYLFRTIHGTELRNCSIFDQIVCIKLAYVGCLFLLTFDT